MKKLSIKDKVKGINEYCTNLELLEKQRNIPITFSLNEIHDLHMALRECILLQKEDVDHKKKYGMKCPYCHNYKNLYKRIVKYCNCVDNPNLEEKE
jgi:hypothetical protein